MKQKNKSFSENKCLPYLACFLLLIPSIFWIFLDNTVWPWDQAWYGEVSVDLYYNLTHSLSLWPKAMLTAFGIKSPAIAWFGQFFVSLSSIFGSIDKALMMQIVIAQFLSLVFMYRIIIFLTNSNKKMALLGSLIMASSPLFVGMGHQYFVESLQLFIVTFVIYIFINIGVWNKYNSIIAFIMAFSYAMLVKITSPLYIFMVALAGFVYLAKISEKVSLRKYFKQKKHIILYVAGLAFFFAVAAWYAVNWHSIFQFMKLASSGSAAELYGSKDSFFNKFYLWMVYFQKSFFIPSVAYVIYFLLGLFSIKNILKSRSKIVLKRSTVLFLLSLSSILLTLVFFSFQINEETRYLLPLLPYVVIIACLILNSIRNSLIINFFILIFFYQYLFINGIALGVINDDMRGISTWVTQKKYNKDNLKNIKIIIDKTCTKESEYKINMIGVELPWLNANSVEYYAMQNRLKTNRKCYYTSVGYAENNMDNAWTRLQSLKPPFFIASNDEISKNLEAFNGVSSQMLQRIMMDTKFMRQDVSESDTIKIFKNISAEK